MKATIRRYRPPDERLARLVAERAEWLAFLRRRVDSEAEAEDLLQIGLLRAVQHGGKIRSDEDLIAWFYRVLRHAVADHHRKRAAEHRRVERLHADMQAAGEDRVRYNTEEMLALCSCLLPRLRTLKPRYAELLWAVDLEGRAPAEVATEQKMTVNSVNVTLHRARQAMRRELKRFCGECADGACLDCGCDSAKSAR